MGGYAVNAEIWFVLLISNIYTGIYNHSLSYIIVNCPTGIEELDIKTYEVKIKLDNAVSIKMFTKIGFSEVIFTNLNTCLYTACFICPSEKLFS